MPVDLDQAHLSGSSRHLTGSISVAFVLFVAEWNWVSFEAIATSLFGSMKLTRLFFHEM